jgi:hypothetical protein
VYLSLDLEEMQKNWPHRFWLMAEMLLQWKLQRRLGSLIEALEKANTVDERLE